jgi:hypothetical protein
MEKRKKYNDLNKGKNITKIINKDKNEEKYHTN